MTSHSRSYGEELQRSIFVQIASAIEDLESAIGITTENARLKRQLAEKTEELNILKKTAAYFAKNQK